MLRHEIDIATHAAQAAIRVNTDEIDDCIRTIAEVCAEQGILCTVWDAHAGWRTFLDGPSPEALDRLSDVLEAVLKAPDEPAVAVVVKNFHLAFEGNRREPMAALVQHVTAAGKARRKFLIGLMPAEGRLPPEVAPLFHPIDHELPDERELGILLAQVMTPEEEATPAPNPAAADEARTIVKAALGLTRLQAEGAFASSLAEFGAIRPAAIWKTKAKILNREGLVELRETRLGFEDVGGLDGFKDFLLRLTAHDPLEDVDPDARFKGVMVVGAPGTGKSLMAECLGRELDLPTMMFNPGNLMGEYVGVTERNTRKFFQTIRRMAPCVVVGDEIAQTMGGGKDANSAVDKRMLGSFLTALNDIKEPVFWFFTANDIEGMHEAFSRAERVDAKVYVRLPNVDQRAEVWRIYVRKFFPETVNGQPDPRHVPLDSRVHLERLRSTTGDAWTRALQDAAAFAMTLAFRQREAFLDATENQQDRRMVAEMLVLDADWTPAEIRACCRLARRLKMPLHEAARRVGHVCIGPKGDQMLERLHNWALSEGALDSETGQLYAGRPIAAEPEPPNGKRVRRKVTKLEG